MSNSNLEVSKANRANEMSEQNLYWMKLIK